MAHGLDFDPTSRRLDFGHSPADKARYYPHHCGHHGCGSGNKKRCMQKGHMDTCEVCHNWFKAEAGGCEFGHHHSDGYNIRAWVEIGSKAGHEMRTVREVWNDVAHAKGKEPGDDCAWETKLREHVLDARDVHFSGTLTAAEKRAAERGQEAAHNAISVPLKRDRDANVSSRPTRQVIGLVTNGRVKQRLRREKAILEQAQYGQHEATPNQKARIWNQEKYEIGEASFSPRS